MRILMLSPADKLSGGVIDFVRMLRARMSAQHHFATTQVGDDASSWPLPIRIVRDAWSLARCIVRERPDVIHINPSLDRAIVRDGLYLLLARLLHRGPLVVFIHGWESSWEHRIGGSRVARGLFRWVYGLADRIYVLSKKYRDRLAEWGLPVDRLRNTSTMFDADLFNGLARQRPVPQGPSECQLLFMARLVADKGATLTVEAFATIAAAYPGVVLVCAGDGPERPQLERFVAARGMSHRVRFPGFVRGREKAQLLLDSDLFVFPTQYGEGCPVSLLEAMGAGLAVVTADAGGIPDVFRNGSNGVLLGNSPTGPAVANAIESLIGDVVALRRIGNHNAAEAHARYEARIWCDALEKDYALLLSSTPTTSRQPHPGR